MKKLIPSLFLFCSSLIFVFSGNVFAGSAIVAHLNVPVPHGYYYQILKNQNNCFEINMSQANSTIANPLIVITEDDNYCKPEKNKSATVTVGMGQTQQDAQNGVNTFSIRIKNDTSQERTWSFGSGPDNQIPLVASNSPLTTKGSGTWTIQVTKN